jgi:hypothetical protein
MMAGLGDGAGVGSGGNAGASQNGSAGGDAGAGNSNSGGGAAGSAGGTSGGTGTPGTSSLGTGGADQKSWRDGLPDDLKADPTLSKYSDVSNLAKAHVELQKKFGQKGFFKPGKDASAEEIRSFREAMGIPTSVDKYELGNFEGVKVEQSIIDWAKKVGTENGIEPTALKAIITDYMKLEDSVKAQGEVAKKEAIKTGYEGLRKEWGDAFDRNIQRANFAAEKIGGKELVAHMVKVGIADDPVILKAFSEAAKLYGEDKLREAGAGEGRTTPQELDGKIAQVQARLFSMKTTDGAYNSVKNEYESLWKQKTGGR